MSTSRWIVLAATAVLGPAALAADLQLGTWMLNPGKSKYNPGPPPQSGVVKIEAHESGIRYYAKAVDAEGRDIRPVEFTANYDGKDYAVRGSTMADVVSLKRLDANTVEFTYKKSGKAVVTATSVVSPDQLTRTVTMKTSPSSGRQIENTAVYELDRSGRP